jgi:glycerophosphoryl diester phosphodiesterase
MGNQTDGLTIIGHRGYGEERPADSTQPHENTIAAFSKLLGITSSIVTLGFELDVARTSDGSLACAHTLPSKSDRSKKVSDFSGYTLEALRSTFVNGDQIPLLSDVIKLLKSQRPCPVEFDLRGSGFEEDVLQLVQDAQLTDHRLNFVSNDKIGIASVNAIAKRIGLACTTGLGFKTTTLFSEEDRDGYNSHPDASYDPELFEALERSIDESGATQVRTVAQDVRPELLKYIKGAGLSLACSRSGEQDPLSSEKDKQIILTMDEWARNYEIPVSLITNYPAAAVKILEKANNRA